MDTETKDKFAAMVISTESTIADAAEECGITLNQAKALMQDSDCRALVKQKLVQSGATAEALELTLMEVIDNDPADFSPVIREKKTLADIRKDGVNTKTVKKIKANGEIEFYDKDKAVGRLMELLGLSIKGDKNQPAKEQHVHIGTLQQVMPEKDGAYERIGRQEDIIAESARAK